MYTELKPPEALSEKDLSHVVIPFLGISALKSAWLGGGHIRGYEAALAACMDRHDRHWDYKRNAFERLCQQVEEGMMVVVERQPLRPAYQQVDGHWQVTRNVRSIRVHSRLERQIPRIQRQRREQALRQSQRAPLGAFEIEDIIGLESRRATLGPHEEQGNQPWNGERIAAAPVSDKAVPINTRLGEDVDSLVVKSPSLQKDLQELKDNKWEIEYGKAGGGSFANRNSRPPKITIDGSLKDNPTAATQTLAHEVGHATYPYKEDYSSKVAYLNGTLADEGAATLNNIKAQREIIANGGPDIGIAGNSANHAAYNNAYDQLLKDGNAVAARQSVGAQFGTGEITSNTGQSYADYYGGWYDKTFPPKTK